MNEIERRLEIPSVRRTPAAREVATQAIIDEVEKDIAQGNGPNYVKSKLQDQLLMVRRFGMTVLLTDFVQLTYFV